MTNLGKIYWFLLWNVNFILEKTEIFKNILKSLELCYKDSFFFLEKLSNNCQLCGTFYVISLLLNLLWNIVLEEPIMTEISKKKAYNFLNFAIETYFSLWQMKNIK